MGACVLLAVAANAAPEADPALLYSGLGYGHGLYGLGYGYGLAAPVVTAPVVTSVVPKVGVVPTAGATPVAVGGYKAVAGSNGDLAGAVHEVPGLVGAPALATQTSAGDVSLTTGTGAHGVTGHAITHHLGKREAEADPAYFYSGLGYGHGLYGLGYGYGLGYAGYGHGLTYATHYTRPYSYYANSAGVVHAVAKREAEPEADPAYFYGDTDVIPHTDTDTVLDTEDTTEDTDTVFTADTDTTDTDGESKKLESTQP